MSVNLPSWNERSTAMLSTRLDSTTDIGWLDRQDPDDGEQRAGVDDSAVSFMLSGLRCDVLG
jgi:hypothetical protein